MPSGDSRLAVGRKIDVGGPFEANRICAPHTPVRAPKANAIAERFVRTARTEWLDWLLIVNRRHLEHVLHVFIDHYNPHRPHRALKLKPPAPSDANVHARARPQRGVDRRDRLGGLIHEYHAAA